MLLELLLSLLQTYKAHSISIHGQLIVNILAIVIIFTTISGKSSLMNRLLGGFPASAVSKKVNTTRHSIQGVITDENVQVILTDLPGNSCNALKMRHMAR